MKQESKPNQPIKQEKSNPKKSLRVWCVDGFDLRTEEHLGSHYFKATDSTICELVGTEYNLYDCWELDDSHLKQLGITPPKPEVREFYQYSICATQHTNLEQI